MRRVILESPYGSDDPAMVQRNVRYARACLADSLRRDEAPFASHLLYTQPGVLDDGVLDERRRGMEAGFAWLAEAEALVVYTDLGVSAGMWDGIGRAGQRGLPVEYRKLGRVE